MPRSIAAHPLPLLWIVLALFACADLTPNPISAPFRAGKATTDQCLAITWDCTPETEPTWTIFYGATIRFQVHGDSIFYTEYISNNSKLQYWANTGPTRRHRLRSGLEIEEISCNSCGLWSEAIQDTSDTIRIYKGEVDYAYRGTKDARYILTLDGQRYIIAYLRDGQIRHRDFLSVHNRNKPRPEGLTIIDGKGFYWPQSGQIEASTACALPEPEPTLEKQSATYIHRSTEPSQPATTTRDPEPSPTETIEPEPILERYCGQPCGLCARPQDEGVYVPGHPDAFCFGAQWYDPDLCNMPELWQFSSHYLEPKRILYSGSPGSLSVPCSSWNGNWPSPEKVTQ